MSSFDCPQCGARLVDTPYGYVTGCDHYPVETDRDYALDCLARDLVARPKQESRAMWEQWKKTMHADWLADMRARIRRVKA